MSDNDDQTADGNDDSEIAPVPPAFDPDHSLVKREIGNDNPRPSPR